MMSMRFFHVRLMATFLYAQGSSHGTLIDSSTGISGTLPVWMSSGEMYVAIYVLSEVIYLYHRDVQYNDDDDDDVGAGAGDDNDGLSC